MCDTRPGVVNMVTFDLPEPTHAPYWVLHLEDGQLNLRRSYRSIIFRAESSIKVKEEDHKFLRQGCDCALMGTAALELSSSFQTEWVCQALNLLRYDGITGWYDLMSASTEDSVGYV